MPRMLTWVFTLLVAVLPGCGWTSALMFPYLEEAKRLEEVGEDGTARIDSVVQTGNYINHQPELELKVTVSRANGETFPATIPLICPLIMLARYQPGNVVPVKLDPVKKTATVTGSYKQTPWMR